MLRIANFLALIISTQFLLAQSGIESLTDTSVENTDCSYDSSRTGTFFRQWDVFQTQDGTIDGEIDSTRCFTVSSNDRIDLSQLNAQYPLFIRNKATSLQNYVVVDSNEVYEFNFGMRIIGAGNYTEDSCTTKDCSGLLIRSSKPSIDSGIRTSFESYIPLEGIPTNRWLNTCYITEKLDSQRIDDFYFAVLLENTDENSLLDFRLNDFDYMLTPSLIDSVLFTENDKWADRYFKNIYDLVPQESFPIFHHHDSGYPSSSNISYVDFLLEENIDSIVELNLNMEFQTVHIQPYTEFRGGLIAGSDSLRHQVVLEQRDDFLCFGIGIVELHLGNNTQWRYVDGNIDFTQANSCINLKDGSELIVTQGSSMHYGNQGKGMLFLGENAHIILEKEAELIFDGILLLGHDGIHIPEYDPIIKLEEGMQLSFTANAFIDDRFGVGKKLYIEMLGGTIDLTQLDRSSRQLIELIYPESNIAKVGELILYPNPTHSSFQLNLGEEIAECSIIDQMGRVVQVYKNLQEQIIHISGVDVGIYMVQILTKDGNVLLAKLVKE